MNISEQTESDYTEPDLVSQNTAGRAKQDRGGETR